MANPFQYGSAVRGAAFGDRQQELKDLTGFMANGINVILLSPRRYGKSSLALAAVERIQRQKGRAARADLARCGASLKDFAEVLASAVFRDGLGGVRGLTRELQRKLAGLGASFRLEAGLGPEGPKLSISLAPRRPDTDWREEIAAILHALCDDAGARPTALVIDEFQRVESIDPTLPWFFKSLADQFPRLSLVFCGSRRTFMRKLVQGDNAPFMGIGESMNLRLIEAGPMVEFIRRRSQDGGKEMQAEAAGQIYRLAQGIPDFAQQLAYHAFEEADGLVTVRAVEQGLARLIDHEVASYAERLDSRATVQQRILKALAMQNEQKPYSSAFLMRAGVATAGSVRKALKPLEDDELIEYSREFGWRVFDPFFSLWLHEPP